MATSFRLPPEQMNRLEQLARQLKQSKAQVVKKAIDLLYTQELARHDTSLWTRLIEGGFQPVDIDLGFDAADEDQQRRIIRERITKKNRH